MNYNRRNSNGEGYLKLLYLPLFYYAYTSGYKREALSSGIKEVYIVVRTEKGELLSYLIDPTTGELRYTPIDKTLEMCKNNLESKIENPK